MNFYLGAICHGNGGLRIQIIELREKGIVSKHMIRGTEVRNPRSKEEDLDIQATRLPNKAITTTCYVGYMAALYWRNSL